jgi:hypothetical protein
MSTRSDVGIAIKKELFKLFSEDDKNKYFQGYDSCIGREEGVLYIFKQVNSSSFDEFKHFLSAASNNEPEMYLLIDVCFDYPEADCDDCGCWYDNPWCLRRVLSVELTWNYK